MIESLSATKNSGFVEQASSDEAGGPAVGPEVSSEEATPNAYDVHGISRTYRTAGPPVHALRDVTMRVPRGSFTAIVGPSGSGKSTLLNMLGLLDRPDTGRVAILGTDTTTLDQSGQSWLRATRLGIVFQAFHLLNGRTVIDNVQLGLLYTGVPVRQRQLRSCAVLDRVHLSHRVLADAATLSGGEKQRVAIARALVAGADILLCDEPTGSLDEATGRSILALLSELTAAGTTVVSVTHDTRVAAAADVVFAVSDGKVFRR